MCGITGYISRNKDEFNFLDRALKIQNHRGPDHTGKWESTFKDYHVGFGHNRLSIIDLNPESNQPMIDEQTGTVLVFNGEIYNYLDLREELKKSGVNFISSGDTEVILRGFLFYGECFFYKLKGMFAFSLWDPITGTLHLLRDHIGKKPLYIRQRDNDIYFSSEIEALLYQPATLNPQATKDYFTYLYIPAPRTIYEEITELPPGNHYKFINGILTIKKYWDINNYSPSSDDYPTALKNIEKLLEESIKKRLVSDRPIGLFLSGGLDSSLIAAITTKKAKKKINTYSIGYDIKGYEYNESCFAHEVADHLGTQHTEITIDESISIDELKTVVDSFDQPFGNPTSLMTFYLTKYAREKNIIVGLVGDGADEVFIGYPRYKYARLSNTIQQYVPRIIRTAIKHSFALLNENNTGNHFLRRIKLFANTLINDNYLYHWSSYFHYGLRKSILKKNIGQDFEFFDSISQSEHSRDPVAKASLLDLQSFVPCNLLESADKMAMQNGFELRAPYLDIDLIEYGISLPIHFRLNKGVTKKPLRDIAKKYLPEKILERPKRGFNPPVSFWLKKLLPDLQKRYIENQKTDIFEMVLEVNALNEMIEKHLTLKMDLSTELWGTFVFIEWYEEAKNKGFLR